MDLLRKIAQFVWTSIASGMMLLSTQQPQTTPTPFAGNTQTPPVASPAVTQVLETAPVARQAENTTLYLPVVNGKPAWVSPFGVEPIGLLLESSLHYTRTVELGAGWVRLGTHVHWRQLQPNEGDPIQWAALAGFEQQLRDLKKVGIRPVVTITDSPHWATVIPSSCAALRADKFSTFADFMRQMVERYKTDEFQVHDWEIGNEPDVDPDLVSADSGFGCWGDYDDPYYGGQHYGEMLKVVGAAIKQADPDARVWIGGLLLNSPNSDPNPSCSLTGKCRPELFLEGVLLSGAATQFDVVAYHGYSTYINQKVDHENAVPSNAWYGWGGVFIGKARFLRQTLQAYGVIKHLNLNEAGLMCPDVAYAPYCIPPNGPNPDFFQMQADFLARGFVRGVAENISGLAWYTLEGPGWRYTGLLNNGAPNPAFIAYQQLTQQLKDSRYTGMVDYGAEIEAYAFETQLQQIQVVWARSDQTINLIVPGDKFIAAYDRDGNPLAPLPAGSNYQLAVGFSPIYLNFSP
jgi:hypothetical protein